MKYVIYLHFISREVIVPGQSGDRCDVLVQTYADELFRGVLVEVRQVDFFFFSFDPSWREMRLRYRTRVYCAAIKDRRGNVYGHLAFRGL